MSYIAKVILYCQFYGGSISKGSELQVEVAEFLWRNVQVSNSEIGNLRRAHYCWCSDLVSRLQLDGSLVIEADSAMGSTRINENGEHILQYGHRYHAVAILENFLKEIIDSATKKYSSGQVWKM